MTGGVDRDKLRGHGPIAAVEWRRTGPPPSTGGADTRRLVGRSTPDPRSRCVVRVGLPTQLKFTAGSDSQGNLLGAQRNRAVLVEDDVDVTSDLVVNP